MLPMSRLTLTMCHVLRPAEARLPSGDFTSWLSTAWPPAPMPDMTMVATGQFPPARSSRPGDQRRASLP